MDGIDFLKNGCVSCDVLLEKKIWGGCFWNASGSGTLGGNWELGREEYVNLYSKFKVQTHQAPGTRPPPITRYASAPYNNKSIKSWDRDLRGYASFRIIYERRMWWPTETIFWFDVWLIFPPSRNGEDEILEAYPIPSIEAFAILR